MFRSFRLVKLLSLALAISPVPATAAPAAATTLDARDAPPATWAGAAIAWAPESYGYYDHVFTRATGLVNLTVPAWQADFAQQTCELTTEIHTNAWTYFIRDHEMLSDMTDTQPWTANNCTCYVAGTASHRNDLSFYCDATIVVPDADDIYDRFGNPIPFNSLSMRWWSSYPEGKYWLVQDQPGQYSCDPECNSLAVYQWNG